MKFSLTHLAHRLLCLAPCLLAANIGFAQSPRVTPPPGSLTPLSPPSSSSTTNTTPASRPGQRPVDRIVAVVNDEVVTANELRARAQVAEMQLRRQKIQPPPFDVLERQVLERLIVDRAQLQLARETGVRVDDATVNATLGRVAESNGLTVQSLRQRLEAD